MRRCRIIVDQDGTLKETSMDPDERAAEEDAQRRDDEHLKAIQRQPRPAR